MPKRSAEDKIVHYKRKIRRLQEKEKKLRRIRRPLDTSDDENSDDKIMDITHNAIPADDSDEDRMLPQGLEVPAHDAGQEAGPASSETPPEPILAPELLSALGASTSDTPDFGEPIHDSLSKLWDPLLRKGLAKEEKSDLMKVYLVPSNCQFLQAPKLNAEISAATSDIVRARDKKLENFQIVLGAGTTAVNRAMDILLKSDDKVRALKSLSDGCRLLTDLHFSFSCDRKKLITPSLEKNFIHMIQDAERDETLFGNSLADKIKASKAIEKQGQEIRKRTNPKPSTSTPQSSVNRPINQGNWTGPPRYSSFKRGRGGQRRGALAGRQPYLTNTTNNQAPPPPPKNLSHSKPRANTQH